VWSLFIVALKPSINIVLKLLYRFVELLSKYDLLMTSFPLVRVYLERQLQDGLLREIAIDAASFQWNVLDAVTFEAALESF
jgi:hypothetical protein